MGEMIAHIEIKAREPLPITSTGYRSHFLNFSEVEEHGGVILFVETWLEKAAQAPEWKEYIKEKKQLKLF